MFSRRVSSAVSSTVAGVAATSQARTYIEINGDTTYRLEKIFMEKDHKGALKKYWSDLEGKKSKTFANRKEEMAHLADRPNYEYISDLQRAATDLTAVYSSPQQYMTDVPYHYHKLAKTMTTSKTNANDGNGEIREARRITPQ